MIATLSSSGTEIGDQTQVGGSLIQLGNTFINMGKMEKEYLRDVYDNFFKPFSNHLQVCFVFTRNLFVFKSMSISHIVQGGQKYLSQC